ncbi:hypothetical protein BC828DRAFT_93462 [Blastocladiella britannica]|nr:hypothetical protein BC828DRAFT_93462 [Blastocladiella britannica]
MMVPLLALLVLSLAFHVSLVSPAALECARPRLRKEVRDLNATEWQALTTAANQLKRNGRMTQYTAVHQQYIQPAHGGALFMAWHRRFIWQFETELLAITGSALSGLPYFDPLMSYSIFDPTNPHFVGEATGCVRTGPMANWMSVDGACLGRALTQQPTYVDPRALTQLILTGQSFEAFGTAYEGGQHADVHNGIGGQMSSLQYAPDDLLFYMHHAHVDQVWWARQYANNMALYWDYQGTHTPGGVGQVTLKL